ncbi:MAG: divalent-cation tolerance protein CutA [Bacteroidales bacterium]|jgi:periplasmic divalent cation tolerance protein|nr:divalent-cation tolerance protein CutA [Bacteroidales bacterium]
MFTRKTKYIIITTTYPNNEAGLDFLVNSLVNEKLAACVQVFPVKSIYTWKDKKEETEELLLVIKTKKILYKKIEEKIKIIHPYEIPQIITIPINKGYDAYLKWIEKNTL